MFQDVNVAWPFPDGQLNHGHAKQFTLDCPFKRCSGFSLECALSIYNWQGKKGDCELESYLTMKITSTSCICPVLVCLCFVQRCYGTAHHSSIKVTRNQTKHIEGETEVHHRPKRGWVWNQFFVLEEHMGPDPQYVGKVSFCFLFFPILRNYGVRWEWSWLGFEKTWKVEWKCYKILLLIINGLKQWLQSNVLYQSRHLSLNISPSMLGWMFFTSILLFTFFCIKWKYLIKPQLSTLLYNHEGILEFTKSFIGATIFTFFKSIANAREAERAHFFLWHLIYFLQTDTEIVFEFQSSFKSTWILFFNSPN